MISTHDLEQLEHFDGHGAPVLSVYLNLQPERQLERAFQIAFKSLVRDARRRLDERGREQLEAEAQRVADWLEGEPPRGQGLAVFSCQPAGLWQAHSLPVPVKDHLAFEETPYLTPLLDLLDEYERYGVVLVDGERARLFTVFLGQIEEDRSFRDAVKVREDHSGWPEEEYERREEAHVYRHLKRVAARLTRLHRRRPFDRLVLGGPEEAVGELRRLLPRPLAGRVVGTFHAELDAGETEILAETLEIERRVEREVEGRLVAELLEVAGGGGRAVYGVSPTLEALWEGAVQKLVVADGLQLSGAECASCRRLEGDSPAACPVCGGPMRPVEDLVERAVDRTLEEDGAVEMVHGDAAQRLREAGGGLGALLRYRTEAIGERQQAIAGRRTGG